MLSLPSHHPVGGENASVQPIEFLSAANCAMILWQEPADDQAFMHDAVRFSPSLSTDRVRSNNRQHSRCKSVPFESKQVVLVAWTLPDLEPTECSGTVRRCPLLKKSWGRMEGLSGQPRKVAHHPTLGFCQHGPVTKGCEAYWTPEIALELVSKRAVDAQPKPPELICL